MDAEARLAAAAAKTSEWLRAARFAEGRAELEELLRACPAPSVARIRGLVAAGTLAFFQGDTETARTHHGEAYALAKELGDDVGVADGVDWPRTSRTCRRRAAGRAYASERALEVRRRLSDESGAGEAIHHLAEGTRMAGDLPGARRLYEESLAIKRSLGSEAGIALELLNLAVVDLAEGDVDAADARLRESLRLGIKLSLRRSNPFRLIGLARVASARFHDARAARLLGAAERRLESSGGAIDPADRADHSTIVEHVRIALGDKFEQHRNEGRALDDDAATMEALG